MYVVLHNDDKCQYHNILIAWYEIMSTIMLSSILCYHLYYVCKNYCNMGDDLQDGSEVANFQEDSLTKDELVNKINTKLHAIWKPLGFQPYNIRNPCSKDQLKCSYCNTKVNTGCKQCVAISLCVLFITNTVIFSNIMQGHRKQFLVVWPTSCESCVCREFRVWVVINARYCAKHTQHANIIS